MGLFDDLLEEDNIQTTPKRGGLFDDLIEEDDLTSNQHPVVDDYFTPRQIATDKSEKDKPFFGVLDTASAIGEAASDLITGVPAAMRRAKVGLIRPDQYSPEDVIAFEAERKRNEQLEIERQKRIYAGEETSVGSAIREAGKSLGFTAANILPAMAGGAAAGAIAGAAFPAAEVATIPIGVIASGIGAAAGSAPVAYRMAGAQFLDDAFNQLESNSLKKNNRPLTEEEKDAAYKELLPIAQNTGIWEAGPDAVGNAVTLGVGKFVFGFGKDVATGIASNAIKSATKTIGKKVIEKGAAIAGDLAVELGGETITQTQQGYDDAKAQQYIKTGSTAGAVDEYKGLAGLGKAFKEVAPATIATMGLMGAVAGGAKLASKPFSNKTETGEEEKNNNAENTAIGGAIITDNLNRNNSPETARVIQDLAANELSDQLESDFASQQAAAAAQQQQKNATKEIIKPEGVRQEPQNGTETQPTNETIVGDSILSATRSEEERQIARDIVSELQAVSNNTATNEQIARLSLDGLVDVRRGQAVINEDGEGILAQAQAPLPKLTPEERAAEVEATTRPLPTDVLPTETPGAEYGREAELFDVFGNIRRKPLDVAEPIIGEKPQFSPMVGEQVAETTPVKQVAETQIAEEPIISEKPKTSEIVGAETPAIVEQEQVAPAVRQEFKDELEMSGVAYDGDTRYSVQQSSDGTFRAERIVNGSREDIAVGLPDIETAQGVIFNSVGKEAPAITTPEIQQQAPSGMSVEEAKAYLEERNKSKILGYAPEDIMAMQQGKRVARTIPSAPVTEQAAPAEAPAPEVAPVTKATKSPKKPLTELEKLENKKQKLILSNAKREKITEINSKIEIERNKQIQNANAKLSAIGFVSELREERKQEQEREQRQISASNWQKTIVDPKEWIVGYDIVRSDTDNLIQTINDGKVSSERTIEIIDDALNNNAITQGYANTAKDRIQKAFPTPAASETITEPASAPTQPEGISVGNRIKLGKSPQTYIIEEAIPQTATEQELGEQYYSVKNERTGEVQVVEERDLKKVGGKKARKIAIATPQQMLWSTPQQEISSAATSINQSQMPATFKKVKWESGTRNADIGGGRFDNATEYLAELGTENVIYDPYNRSQESNQVAVEKISGGQSDTATVNNVLNVIAEPESRDLVIRQAADAIKSEGKAYFLIYEGNSKGVGSQTKSGWQENRKAETYIAEIKNHFGNVTRKGNLIIVENPVKTEEPLRQSAEFKNEEIVTPIPEVNRYTFEEAVKAVDAHFGKQGIPEGVVIVNNTTDKNLEMKAGYFVDRGQIVINLAYIAKGENLGDIIDHELGHYIFGDPKFNELFKSFWESMTPEEQTEADIIINQFYNKETGSVQMEEKQIRAFMQLIQDSKAMPKWKRLLDSIKRWINEKLGTNFLVTDRNALAVLAAAHKRFKNGEQIVREIDSGVLKMAAEPRREQVGGEEREQSKYITTPKGIIAKNTDIIRQKFFDGTKVSPENTTEAWGYIERLLDIESGSANELAGIINDTIETELKARMNDDIAAGKEVDLTDDVNKRIGAAMFSVELMNYAGRLADQGDPKMLERLIRDINDMPVDNLAGGISEGARALRTRLEYDVSGFGAYTADQAGKVDRTAATLFGTGNPSKEQVKVVKEAIKASDKTEVGSAEEIAGEIENIEKRTKRKVVSKIEDQISGNIEEKRKAALEKQKARPATPSSVERQAISVIDQLARIQSDTPAFAEKQENLIKAIVQQDLRQKPRMNRKEAWTNQLTGKLIQAGASETQALTISDLVWRQHEIKAMDRELKELQTAAEKGSLAVIVQRIKDTPLAMQQEPNWMQGVIREYLVEAGLSENAAKTAARLYESVISERFAEAKQKAFEAALNKSAPWNNFLSRNVKLGKDALKKIQEAIRTGVLDPTQTTESIIAKQNGWSGFSKEQLTRIVQLDDILSDSNTDQVTKAEAVSELNKIIVKAKMPVRFKDAISSFYVAQALDGVPTLTVNISSPTFFAIRNLAIDVAKYAVTDPQNIPVAFQGFMNSMQNWKDNSLYAFKNQIYMSGEIEYMQGQNVLRELFDKGMDQWKKGEYANGMANMLVGMMQITGRVLSSLDQGAIAMMESQNIPRYALDAMASNKKIPKDKRKEIANIALYGRSRMRQDLIASGMSPERAGVLADLQMRSELMGALSEYGISKTEVLDASLNDALQSVGRNRVITTEGFKKERNNLRDAGITSGLAIGFLENLASSANKGGQAQQVFAKMLYGFALVPARVFSTALWFSPVGFVRLGVDSLLKKAGIESRYAMSLATDLQYKQRVYESIAGTVLLGALASLVKSSTDDEDDELPFKIVATGNGPNYTTDPQYYDSWNKRNKPGELSMYFGKTKFTLNIGRGGEAVSIPFMIAGAFDDWNIKSKQNAAKNSPKDLEMAAEVLGSAFYAYAQRGPWAAFGRPLFDAKKQDKLLPELFGKAAYLGKTFVPVLGTSLARNISDFINDPVDKSSIQGAIYANTPVIGPMLGTKALNALGQPIRGDDWNDKLFKLGAPLVFSFPKNSPENDLNTLILKKGDGPTIPTRTNAQKKFGDVMTDKEFETYVREYGRVVSDKMFKNRKRLEGMDSKNYTKELDKYVNGYSIDGIKVTGASDMAVRAVRKTRNQ